MEYQKLHNSNQREALRLPYMAMHIAQVIIIMKRFSNIGSQQNLVKHICYIAT